MDTDNVHELALDALMRTIEEGGDGLRNRLSPLVSAIGDLWSDYADSWESAREVLEKAANR